MLIRVCAIVSLIVIATTFATIFLSAIFRKKKIKSYYLLFGGAIITAVFLFLPIYFPQFEAGETRPFFTWLLTVLASFHHTIRLFVVDADFDVILETAQQVEGGIRHLYNFLAATLFILCPALTAGGILSFFENFTAYRRYLFHYFRDTYIFSDLNDRSIKLARSLKNNDTRRMIVFTDVFKTNEESSYELIKQAQELDAVLFKNDITVVNFRLHSHHTKLFFFVIGDDETENINQTISLTAPARPRSARRKNVILGEQYKFNGYDYPRHGGDTRVFLFTTQASSEQQLSSVNPSHLRLRRVNDVQSLIYRLLYDEGHEIFRSAAETGNTFTDPFTGEQTQEKLISALIVGLGHHGTEMLKALSWFCQLYPYRLELTALEKDKHALSRIRSQCPDLMSKKHNGDFTTPGEAHYRIRVNPPLNEEDHDGDPVGYDVHSDEFDRLIQGMGRITYVLVSLGNDDLNIQIAAKIRVLLKRKGLTPFIHTIVYNPDKQELLQTGTNYSGMMYNINPIGNIASNYSEECILNSEIEAQALARHMAWVEKAAVQYNWSDEEFAKERAEAENAFWKYDYNYRSSVASALHAKFKKGFCVGDYELIGVPGADKPPAERTPEELQYLRIMEHQRWNAYVRSEGFVYAAVRDKLAKTHNLLVPFEELSQEEKEKDDD